MNFLNLFMVGIALVGFAQGTVEDPPMNCTGDGRIVRFKCGLRMILAGWKIQNTDLNDKDDMKEVKQSCDAVDDCVKRIGHCEGFNDERAKKTLTMIRTYCKTVDYLVNEFSACADRIKNTNSTCEYNLDINIDDEDLENKQKVEEECEKIFGKDQCLKKEVLQHCSKKDWEGYRDHYIAMNNDILKICDFTNVV